MSQSRAIFNGPNGSEAGLGYVAYNMNIFYARAYSTRLGISRIESVVILEVRTNCRSCLRNIQVSCNWLQQGSNPHVQGIQSTPCLFVSALE